MKKFVLTFLIFTIGLEVLVRTTTVPWIFEPSFSQIGSLRSVEKEIVEADSTKIVFLGNSLTRDAVSPLIVSDSLNLNVKKILVIGGAGTIGSNYIKEILVYKPSKLVVVDFNVPCWKLGTTGKDCAAGANNKSKKSSIIR